MSETAITPREQARQLVAKFVRKTCTEAREDPGAFTLCPLLIEKLYADTGEVLSDDRMAAELVDRALRYVAFFLADCGLHGEAMKAAVAIHEYHARLMAQSGRGGRALATRLVGFSIRVSWDPIKVGLYTMMAYLGLVGALLSATIITYSLTGETAITLSGEEYEGQMPGVYHHFYFAAVTLTTVGYGDIRPNLTEWWGIFTAGICAGGALCGYLILAAVVSVVMSRSGIHPYARLGDWMEQFEREVLGGPIPLFEWVDEGEPDGDE